MDYKDKADSLADKMNKLSEKFNLAEELTVAGTDIEEYIEAGTKDIELYQDIIPAAEIVNIENLVSDFKYIRETLRETTENGRRVLNSITLDLLAADEDTRAALVISFAELNKAVGNNMKLYMQSYKDISATLLNIDKVKKMVKDGGGTTVTNNTLNVNNFDAVNTLDLIKQLQNKK